MLGLGLQLHQVNHVDHADLQLRHFLRRIVTAAITSSVGVSPAHAIAHVRLLAVVAACPLPDSHALGTVLHRLLHRQPLGARMFGGHERIDVILAPDAVIKAGNRQFVSGGRYMRTTSAFLLAI